MAQLLLTKPVSFFQPDPNQPRKHFDEAALRGLGESLRVRQNDPVQAKPDGTLIDGERRWRAAMLAGLEQLDAIITDAEWTDSQINLVRLTSFFHREDLTAFEKWSACRQILELNPGWLANRVKCLLPSGVQVIVCGNAVSLEESIEALTQAIKEMKWARELGYTSKTFAAAMNDKARKG